MNREKENHKYVCESSCDGEGLKCFNVPKVYGILNKLKKQLVCFRGKEGTFE